MAQHAWKEAREVSARRHARPGFAARSAMNRPGDHASGPAENHALGGAVRPDGMI